MEYIAPVIVSIIWFIAGWQFSKLSSDKVIIEGRPGKPKHYLTAKAKKKAYAKAYYKKNKAKIRAKQLEWRQKNLGTF